MNTLRTLVCLVSLGSTMACQVSQTASPEAANEAEAAKAEAAKEIASLKADVQALMSGVGLEVIGKLLGHSDIKTTRRYAHLADVVVRAAAESTADQIAELMKFGEPAALEPPSSPPPAAPPPPCLLT